MSRLIVIEGVDSSGKATLTQRVLTRFSHENPLQLTFPCYHSPSSALVKMYLNGDFGKEPKLISPYVSSAFYAVDRAASFLSQWKEHYFNQRLIIADRYVTSNMIHQAAKIEDTDEKNVFLDWLWDFEYNKLQLPQPDIVFFMDMPPEFSLRLIKEREVKIPGDIHEQNIDYLKESYQNALYVSEKYGFTRIPCTNQGKLRPLQEIENDICDIVIKSNKLEVSK